MLKFQTFGGAYLIDDSGQPMRAAAGRRRNLALLSMLSVFDAGLSRDRIVGLLWPDTGEERARHSLTQALYLIRQALRCDDLFLVGADIRLNPARITSDVREFGAALQAGDGASAVALYRGTFLDGFFLSGAPEFEQWVTAQRARFEDQAMRALESLAVAAETSSDVSRMVVLRKQAAVLRPLDSGAALQLMKALAAAGDRGGALQHAQVHAKLLREQLDLSPAPEVAHYVAELRAEAPVSPTIDDHRPNSAEPIELHSDVIINGGRDLEAFQEQARSKVLPVEVWLPRRQGRRRVLESAVVALVLVTLVFWVGRGREPTAGLEVLPVRQQVVVAPFRVAGASSSLAYLREGLVELLSTRLADDSVARSVDAGAVLGAWRRAGLTGHTEVTRDTVVQLANRLGAKRVVIGNVVGARSRTLLSAIVLGVPTGAIEAEATVEGPADSIAALVDRLAARLLASQAGEDIRLADRTTASLPALRAYLQGQSAYRQASYAAALRHYTRALELDRTFALAALRLALAADRLNDVQLQRRALATAWKYRSELDDRELAHLTALAGPSYPDPSSAALQLNAWEQLVLLAPDRAEGWYELGARLFRDGRTLGIADAHSRAVTFFQRALSIDPTFQLARQFLLQLGVQNNTGLELPNTSVLNSISPDSLGALAPFIQWRLALARSDSVLLRSVRDTLPALGPVNLRTIAMASEFDGVGMMDGFIAMEVMLRRAAHPYERIDALLALHSFALLQGRPTAALEFTEQMARAEPASRTHLRMRVLDAIYDAGDPSAARQAAGELERLASGARAAGSAGTVQPTDLCVVGQWRLSQADTTGMRKLIARLRTPDFDDASAYLSTPARLCAEMLDAALAVRTSGRDALPNIHRLDSLALSAAVAADLSTYAHLWISRLYTLAGEPALALLAIRRRPYMAGWPRYLATAWREEGLLAQAAGDATGALHAYRRYLALRAAPEASLAAEAADVRGRFSSLQQ